MQMFSISSSLYPAVKAIYGTIAKIYDIIIDLNSSLVEYNFQDLTQSIYVVAGVFMLFRVLLGLIGMILNPDQVSDSNTGAGKMITRIIMVILMLLAFAPNGIIFDKQDSDGDGVGDGLLLIVEDAIIGDDGFLENFNIENIETQKTQSASNGVFYDSVEATEYGSGYTNTQTNKWNKTCYYLKSDLSNIDLNYYVVHFTNTKNSDGNYVKISADANIYATRPQNLNFEDNFIKGQIATGIKTNATTGLNSSSYVGNCENWYYNKDAGTFKYSKKKLSKNSLYKGYNTYNALENALKDNIQKNTEKYLDYCDSHTCTETMKTYIKSGNDWLPNVKSESVAFSKNVINSFLTCRNEEKFSNDITCNEYLDVQFGGVAEKGDKDSSNDEYITSDTAQEELTKMMEKGVLELDPIMAFVAALVIIAFLVILCVDVVIRQLKLMLLEMIAPIPIISYADPKDKVFANWGKMFISTYLDLFIKLFAIKIALVLFQQIEGLNLSGLNSFFVIIGTLLFTKAIPGMISKLFGLEIGSSFKDIMNMTKAGVGLAAGAALGGVVGAATGSKGIGQVTGAISGALRGAGAGAKGNITGGAQSISATNARINQQKADGLNFMDRALIGAAAMTGYSPKTRLDNQIKSKVDSKSLLDNFRKHKDNIENMADSSNYMSDLKVKMQNGEIGKEEYKAARSDFIELNENSKQWMRQNENGNIEIQNEFGEWQDTGTNKYKGNYKVAITNNNGEVTGWKDIDIKYEGSAAGKIDQAEKEMRAEFNSNSSLRTELGMEGKQITNFKSYEAAETIAKDKSNQYSTEIIEVQKSDQYGKASAFDEYSKSGK